MLQYDPMPDTGDIRPRTRPIAKAGASTGVWLLTFALAAGGLGVVFWDGLVYMSEFWDTEEYSHGSLIPIIAAFLIWQQKDALEAAVKAGAGRMETGGADGVGAGS
jgi:hypothetical protein